MGLVMANYSGNPVVIPGLGFTLPNVLDAATGSPAFQNIEPYMFDSFYGGSGGANFTTFKNWWNGGGYSSLLLLVTLPDNRFPGGWVTTFTNYGLLNYSTQPSEPSTYKLSTWRDYLNSYAVAKYYHVQPNTGNMSDVGSPLPGGATLSQCYQRAADIEYYFDNHVLSGPAQQTVAVGYENTAHYVVDQTSATALEALTTPFSLGTLITYIASLKAICIAHAIRPTVHMHNDTALLKIVLTTDPPTTLAHCISDLNDILAALIAHDSNGSVGDAGLLWVPLGGGLTSVKTAAYTAALGETVLYNPTGGAFTLTLPPLTGSGRDVAFVNVSASTTAVLIQGAPGGTPQTGTGSINNGQFTITVVSGLTSPMIQVGDPITIAGAGPAGGLLSTTVTGLGLGTIDVSNAASTTVVAAAVIDTPRQGFDGAGAFSVNAAWRAVVVRDVSTMWKKMSLF